MNLETRNHSRRHHGGLLFIVVVFLLAIVTHSVDAALSDEAAAFYEQGEERFLNGDYEGAILELKNLLRITPGDISARYLAGRSYLRLGDAPAAEKEFRHAQQGGADADLILVPLGTTLLMQGKYSALLNELNPLLVSPAIRPEIHLMRARAYLSLEDLLTARSEFEFAQQLQPDRAAPILGQARIALRQGDRNTARELVTGATQVEPGDPNGWFMLAELQRLDGELDHALNNYTRALDIAPNQTTARVGRAATLIDLGRDDAAFNDIEHIRRQLPKDPQANYLLSLLKSRSGDPGAASSLLGGVNASLKALDTRFLNKHAPSLLLYGIVAYRQGKIDEAIEHLQRFITLRPHHTGGRKLLANIYLQLDKAQSAIDTLKPEAGRHPEDVELLQILGKTYIAAKRFPEAQTALRSALALDPANGDIAMQLAHSLRASGRRKEARDVLKAALERSPQNLKVGLLLGEFYLDLREEPSAIMLARGLNKLHPRTPAVFNLAGRAQMRRGRVLGARKAFQQALSLDIKNRQARLGLANLAALRGNFEEAQTRYQRILGEYPDELRAMTGLARIAEIQGHNNDAIAWLENVRAADRSSLSALLSLLNLYLQQNLLDKASAVFADLDQTHAKNPAVQLSKARVELAARTPEKARKTLADLVPRVSRSAPWLHRAALLQIQAKDTAAALTSLLMATSAEPAYLPSQQELVALELKLNRPESAARHARGLRERYPKLVIGDLLSGDVFMHMQRYHQAISAYRSGLQKKPNLTLTLRLAQAMKSAGQAGAARQLVEQWLQKHPRHRQAREFLAQEFLAAGGTNKAQGGIDDLLRRYPRDPAILNNIAWLYLRGGDQVRALALAQKALELAPQEPSVLDTVGWLRVLGGENSEGLELLRQAHVLAASEPTVRYHLAVALSNAGQVSRALELLQNALQSEQQFEGRDQALKLLNRLRQG